MFRGWRANRRSGPRSDFIADAEFLASTTPKVLWIELTSKCPYDCVFCTRRTRFGSGQHLDFEIYKSLLGELQSPDFIGLNYSGESIVYPRLIEAIELAVDTGASTELVTSLSSISGTRLEALVASGLDRLAVSLHTMDAQQYRDIYRFGSLDLLKQRVNDFFRIRSELGRQKPRLDFCFVAIHENLAQLSEVVCYAAQVGAAEVFVHPVIGRHPLPYDFSREISANRLRESFKFNLREAVAIARRKTPGVPITVLNPDIDLNPQPGPVPAYFAGPLPKKARIHTCDQSPFESVHILANGDVVICEVHDETPIGNLRSLSLREIWQSDAYREFRRKYVVADISECRDCVWKIAYLPSRWKSVITAADGKNPQLLRGWYWGERETVIWGKRESLLSLWNPNRGKRVHIAGVLPRALMNKANVLRISCNKHEIGRITNTFGAEMRFDEILSFAGGESTLNFEFMTEHTFRPALWGINSDTRDLGFGLERIELLR
jgi:MoaA/NifB/PqqE/SkfB family radical SAM enzyme